MPLTRRVRDGAAPERPTPNVALVASENVYLDYNATTPLRPGVVEATADAMARTGNASSVHGPGRAAREASERGRDLLSDLIGGARGDLIFTSGGTEANNVALRVKVRAGRMFSAVEHESVRGPWSAAGAEVLPVDARGIVDLDVLKTRLAEGGQPALVSVMAANNETGVIQPMAAIASIAHERGALVHCDAAQAVGRIAVDVDTWGVDLLTISAHKLGGPQGVGALWHRDGVLIEPLLTGGGQERGRRAGTENVAAIVGFGAAVEAIAKAGPKAEGARIEDLRNKLEKALRDHGGEIAAATAERLPNTCCVRMPGVDAATQVMALDLAGIAVSAGAACSAGKVERSHVLEAMGWPPAAAGEAIRISLGWATIDAHIERAIAAWRVLRERTAHRQAPTAA